jgi:ATP-binding cassette subfamily F protein 3
MSKKHTTCQPAHFRLNYARNGRPQRAGCQYWRSLTVTMTTILTARSMSKSYGVVEIFDDLTVHILAGQRIALVGLNGAGKTTLLRLLAEVEEMDDGQLVQSRGLRKTYLTQESELELSGPIWQVARDAFPQLQAMERQLKELEAAMAASARQGEDWEEIAERYANLQQRFELAGGYDYERRIRETLMGLGFSEAEFEQESETLSGGQRTRLALALALLGNPDLLLLDEPTNHLDIGAIEWLEGFLQRWQGSLVVISHDRRFLDNVATHTWDLDFGSLETYPGNYSRFLELKAERLARRQAEYEAQQSHIAKEEDFIRRYKAGQRSKEARGREKRLARMERLDRPRQHRQLHFNLHAGLRSGDVVLATENLAIAHPDGSGFLLRCPDLEIRRGECVALIGPNGSGKTSFLRTLLDELPPYQGEVLLGHGVSLGYFAQTHSWMNLEQTVLQSILEMSSTMSEGRARSILGRFLFSGDDVFKKLGDLSGGERSRVALARLTLTAGNFLLLDEPTNHLDIPAREALEKVLDSFEGTILLVSHDRALIDTLASQVWAVEDEHVRPYLGNYSEYLRVREAEIAAAEKAPEDNRRRKKQRREEETQARRQREMTRQLHALEEEIAELEEQRQTLEQDMARASHERKVTRLIELNREHQSLQEQISERYQKWAELAEELGDG